MSTVSLTPKRLRKFPPFTPPPHIFPPPGIPCNLYSLQNSPWYILMEYCNADTYYQLVLMNHTLCKNVGMNKGGGIKKQEQERNKHVVCLFIGE